MSSFQNRANPPPIPIGGCHSSFRHWLQVILTHVLVWDYSLKFIVLNVSVLMARQIIPRMVWIVTLRSSIVPRDSTCNTDRVSFVRVSVTRVVLFTWKR
ncbi:unnamed protein product [Cochlearia groenlandica]